MKIRDLQESPHLACGHLLPEGEDKGPTGASQQKKIKFANEINGSKILAQWQTALGSTQSENPRPLADRRVRTALKNPRPVGRGGTASAVGEGLDQMRKK